MATGVRQLNASMLPRTRFEFRSTKNGVIVKATEIADRISCSQYAKNGTLPIFIDEQGGLLKRVAAFASIFQRYRFRRFRIKYQTAAPATRSGLVAFAVSQSYDDDSPQSVADFAAFENSLVTPVSTNAVGKDYVYDGNEWWETSRSQYSVDPNKVVQLGLHGYVGDAAAADDSAIAGFVACEYELEFDGLRPIRPTKYIGTGVSDYANSSGVYQVQRVNQYVAGDRAMIKAQSDMFSTEDSKEDFGTLLLDGAKYLYQIYSSWGAVAMAVDTVTRPPQPGRVRYRCAHKSRAEALQCELHDEPVGPLAAGDIVVTFYSVLDGAATAIFSATIASGTGAVQFNRTNDYDSVPGEGVYFKWAPTGTEVRTMDVSDSFMDMTLMATALSIT